METMMKKTIVFAAALCCMVLQGAWAQKVWTEPAVVRDPTDSVKIYIDLTQMDCNKLVGFAGPLYMWSWMPAEPVGGNGTWSASNTDHAFVNESPDIWSITILPTDFYGVSAQDVYEKDIFFLAKALDGGGGGDCSAAGNEWKTEDLTVEVNQDSAMARKVFTFPDVVEGDSLSLRQNDIFTLRYDNSLEEKLSMQDVTDLYVYARAYDTDGNEYRPSPIAQVGNHPELKMTQDGENYTWSIWPEKVFNIPVGKTLDYVSLQIMKPNLVNSDDAVDGLWVYHFRCQ